MILGTFRHVVTHWPCLMLSFHACRHRYPQPLSTFSNPVPVQPSLKLPTAWEVQSTEVSRHVPLDPKMSQPATFMTILALLKAKQTMLGQISLQKTALTQLIKSKNSIKQTLHQLNVIGHRKSYKKSYKDDVTGWYLTFNQRPASARHTGLMTGNRSKVERVDKWKKIEGWSEVQG